MPNNIIISDTGCRVVKRGCNFPCSLGYEGYPEEAYCQFLEEIEIIKSEKIPMNEKWEKKLNSIRTFIKTNNCHPYWFYKFLGCNTSGVPLIKTKKIFKYRSEKILDILECNFITGSGKKCKHILSSVYNYKKDGLKCSYHLRRCPNCETWIDSQCSNKKYDNYCARCFKRLFPDDPRSLIIREKSKEILVRNAIAHMAVDNKLFDNFIHDKPLYTGNCECTHRRRIDHRKLFGNTILAIETDEFAHRGYDNADEIVRYDDLYMIHSGKWIFIRFNPDNTSDFKMPIKKRIEILMIEIAKQITRIQNELNTELLEIIKLFY